MFYLYKGKVHVTPVGETVREYKDLHHFCKSRYRNERLFIEICYYVFFVYHKIDSLGNKNAFNAYPINERREVIVDKYELFIDINHPTEKGKKLVCNDLYLITDKKGNFIIKDFIEFYKSICYSESELTLETFREKIQHWREKYKQINNTAEQDKEFAAALALAEKHYKEYEIKVMLEASNEAEGSEGCALYLFEIPESQKPMHHRLTHGDLKKK